MAVESERVIVPDEAGMDEQPAGEPPLITFFQLIPSGRPPQRADRSAALL